MRIASLLLCSLLIGTAHASPPASDLWRLYQESLRQDPRLLQAIAQKEAANQREREAMGQLLPQLSLNNTFSRAEHDYETATIRSDGASHSLNLTQPLYAPGSWRSYQKYQELNKQQYWAETDTNTDNALRIAELYFAILASEDELALNQAELKATQRNQQRVHALYKRQMAMLTDVLESDARAAILQTNILDAENAVHSSRNALAERIGRTIDEPLKRLPKAPDYAQLLRNENDWVQQALMHNPALRSRSHGVAAADKAYREAQAEHLPRVNLTLSAQRSDIDYESNPTPEKDTLIASIGIQVPLYSGGSTTARSSALYAEKDAASYDYERLKREVVRETQTALLNVKTGPERIKAAEQSLHAAEKSRQAAEKAFELGVYNAVEVLERVRDEFRARRDLLRSHYTYITNLLLLYRWTGTLSEHDIRHSSALLEGEM